MTRHDSNRASTLGQLPLLDADASTILDALAIVDQGAMSIAIAVDADDHLVGIVTDGDIRRALLAGEQLDGPLRSVINEYPLTARANESRSGILDLMQARKIEQVPILDEDGRIVGVHTLQELLGHVELSNCALVLAGGRGTRLHPLTEHTPKPMVEVAGRPILERLITHLVGHGIKDIVLSIGYLGEVIEDHFGDGSKYGCRVRYLRENPSAPLGSGGPLSLFATQLQLPDEPLLVMNGDLVTQFSVGALIEHHAQSNVLISIAAVTYSYEVPFGVLATDAHGRVLRLDEKPVRDELVNAGIYVLSPEVIARIPPDTVFPITDLISECLMKGGEVVTWSCDAGWVDVGQHQDLSRARGLE